MLVKDLIEQLQNLNSNNTVGIGFYDGGSGMFTFGNITTIEKHEDIVEETTDSVVNKCDYYIN